LFFIVINICSSNRYVHVSLLILSSCFSYAKNALFFYLLLFVILIYARTLFVWKHTTNNKLNVNTLENHSSRMWSDIKIRCICQHIFTVGYKTIKKAFMWKIKRFFHSSLKFAKFCETPSRCENFEHFSANISQLLSLRVSFNPEIYLKLEFRVRFLK
jgi:hypothetical protein